MPPNPLLLFIRAYWLQIIGITGVLILVAYTQILKHEKNTLQRDNASLTATIAQYKAIGEEQNVKSDNIEAGSRQAVTAQATMYESTIKKIKDYYVKNTVTKPISSSLHDNTANSGSGKVSSIPVTAEQSTESRGNIDPATINQDIEQSCAITTAEYNSLWQSWADACKVAGCK